MNNIKVLVCISNNIFYKEGLIKIHGEEHIIILKVKECIASPEPGKLLFTHMRQINMHCPDETTTLLFPERCQSQNEQKVADS